MPFRAESSSFRAYSARKPFPFHVCTMDADGSSRKIKILACSLWGTLGMLVPFVSVRLLVAFHQCLFYVGSPVENLAAYLCIRQNSVVAVVLQCSPAHFQQVCHFLVRQQFIAIGRRLPFLQQLFEQDQQPVEI